MVQLFRMKFLVNFCNVYFLEFHSLHLFTISFVFLTVQFVSVCLAMIFSSLIFVHILYLERILLNFSYADVAFDIFHYFFNVYLSFHVFSGILGKRRNKYIYSVHHLMHYPNCMYSPMEDFFQKMD